MTVCFVRVGNHLLNVSAVVDANWEKKFLYVHFSGGAFAKFEGDEAHLVWEAISRGSIDLKAEATGEEGGKRRTQ